MRIATLLIGSLLFLILAGPLGLLFFLLIWIDALVLFDTVFVKVIGIDLITLAAIMSGIALGPVLGFIFGLLVIPGIVLLFVGLVHRYWMIEFLPSMDYLYAGIAAGVAGLLSLFLPFLITVVAAVFLRFIASSIINKNIYGNAGLNFAFINIIFTLVVLMGLNATGILGIVG